MARTRACQSRHCSALAAATSMTAAHAPKYRFGPVRRRELSK
jgi:hypothetical protein